VGKKIKLLINIFLLALLLLTSSKAELTNKIIISVGSEIISNYDLAKEIKYLNVITVGRIKNLDNQELRKIAIDSLIKDKIKVIAIANYNNIVIKDELINNQIFRSAQNIGFKNVEDLKTYLNYEEYEFDEFKKKILLELKWNQLIYQFYKNQIIVDKEKIDKKLEALIAEQKKTNEYLIYEIFIKDTAIKKLNTKSEKASIEHSVPIEKQDEIIIATESVHYNNEKNLKDTEKSIEEVTDVKVINQITIDDLIKNIKENGFENTAIKFSSSPTAQQGGELGWVSETKFNQLLLKFIKKTKIGSITEPISIPEGILILKVKNKRIEENKIDFNKKMNELIEIEKNKQLSNFSTNYYNQLKMNTKVKYFND
jgi:hypothetical protein